MICKNPYWGWGFHGFELAKGLETINQELVQIWETLGSPESVTELGTGTQPELHGLPNDILAE